MGDQITETLFNEEDFDTNTPGYSEPLPVNWMLNKSLLLVISENGDIGGGVALGIEASADGETFVPLDDDLDLGGPFTGDLTEEYSGYVSLGDLHMNYMRLKVENKCTTPGTNYPTVTAILMGRK